MTATLPDAVPVELYGRDSGPHDWYYETSSLYHNGREIASGFPDISCLDINQKVGFLLSAEGHLHIYVNGRHITKAASGLPVNQRIWGIVDVYGRCTKIRSELLKGEWDSVCIMLWL